MLFYIRNIYCVVMIWFSFVCCLKKKLQLNTTCVLVCMLWFSVCPSCCLTHTSDLNLHGTFTPVSDETGDLRRVEPLPSDLFGISLQLSGIENARSIDGAIS